MELLTNPLDVVSRLFDLAGRPAQDNGDWGEVELARQLLSNSSVLSQVPWLTPDTIDTLPNNSLVRYRGMVRDMFNKEIYAGLYRGEAGMLHTTKYSDVDIPNGAPEPGSYWERQALYCVPVPSESLWCQSRFGGAPLCPPTPERGCAEPRKRLRDDESMSDPSGAADGMCMQDAADAVEVSSASKRQAVDKAAAAASAPQAAALQHDIGNCITYVYGDVAAKLHDVVEVVGIVSKVPQLAALQELQEEDMMDDYLRAELAATHPPTSLVFRVHALLVQREASVYPPPLTPVALLQANAAILRERALGFLSLALGGDRLACEYTLLHLLANYTASSLRSGNLSPVHLNLTRCPAAPAAGVDVASPLGRALEAALSALAPRCRCLPLTLAGLNTQRLAPSQDAVTSRLLPGMLQLAPGSLLVVDETVLDAGHLGDAGCKNIQVLTQLMSAQTVPCELPYGSLDLPVDVPVLCLSTARSVFKGSAPLVVPLHHAAVAGDAAADNVADMVRAAAMQADLDPVRDYLGAVRGITLDMPEDVQEAISHDYAAARQEDAAIGPELLHIWLTVGKLLAVSHGDSCLSLQRWREARALEHQREERLRVV